jgi:hypothetical protein
MIRVSITRVPAGVDLTAARHGVLSALFLHERFREEQVDVMLEAGSADDIKIDVEGAESERVPKIVHTVRIACHPFLLRVSPGFANVTARDLR